MPTPATRTPIRIGRGTYSNLNSSISDILDGEVVYATDQDKLYFKKSGALVASWATTTEVSSTYQTQAGMSSYLTITSAGATYQPLSGMSSYLTTASATSTYLTIATAGTTYQTQSGMSSYRLKADLDKVDASVSLAFFMSSF
jgi:hypothetical protein